MALRRGPLTHGAMVRRERPAEAGRGDLIAVDPGAGASAALRWELADVAPAVSVIDDRGETWIARRDLLGSDRFAPHFVVEMESEGTAWLRFGDGVTGRRPAEGSRLSAEYRIGGGRSGNVGAEAIAHVVFPLPAPGGSPVGAMGTATRLRAPARGEIEGVRNPLPAVGGTDAEPLEQVRLNAPHAFRVQERAVTESDYAEIAERHPDVQRAMATRRWTGSWPTMFVTIDRRLGRGLDEAFEQRMRAYLERYRLTGHDVEIDAPTMVALHIEGTVCATPDAFRSDVRRDLLDAFSNPDLSGGGRGFFHPDNFTFGTPVFLSRVVAAAMSVAGVSWVEVTRFGRLGEPEAPRDPQTGAPLLPDRIGVGRLEIIRLDNDPSAPEFGRIEFTVEGGL